MTFLATNHRKSGDTFRTERVKRGGHQWALWLVCFFSGAAVGTIVHFLLK